MAEHARGEARLLDLGVAVHECRRPSAGPSPSGDRPAADGRCPAAAPYRHRVENLARLTRRASTISIAGITYFGRVQHVGKARFRAFQGFPENERELDLDARDRSSFECGTFAPSAIIM